MPSDAFIRNLLERAQQEEQQRILRIADAWACYEGDHPESLSVREGGPNDNLPVNICRTIVDKGVSYLFGTDLQFGVEGSKRNENGGPSNLEAKAEDYIEEVLQYNHKMSMLRQYALNGAISGHPFMRLHLPVNGGLPRITLLDPSNVRCYWEPQDYMDVHTFIVEYAAFDREGKIRMHRSVIERAENRLTWTITDQRSESAIVDPNVIAYTSKTDWKTVGVTPWPYEFPPIIQNQNLPRANEFYGESDLPEDIQRLNYGMNALVSNMMRIIRNHAHPRTIAKGVTAAQAAGLPNDPEYLLALPRPDSELYNLEMQSDLASSLNLLQSLREALHETARIPEVAVGRLDNIGALSGTALQILYGPLTEKTEDKRLTYGHALTHLAETVLAIGGYTQPMKVRLTWPEVVPVDPVAEAQTAILLQQAGVSKDTTVERLGYDPEQEKLKRTEETAELGDQLLAGFDQGTAQPVGTE